MAVKIVRGQSDPALEQIVGAMNDYQQAHPAADIGLYRQNSVSIRVRIIDPAFHGIDKVGRHAEAWRYLEQLPEDAQSDISMLLLLAPREVERSFANFEFEDPIPSRL